MCDRKNDKRISDGIMKNSKKLTYISRAVLMILTCVLIILFFGIMSLVSRIQGTARVVNYAGLVRGKTQRIIKLEDAGQPQDGMIADIDAFIEGLRRGRYCGAFDDYRMGTGEGLALCSTECSAAQKSVSG